MAGATVRITGLREVNRAFGKMSGDIGGELKDGLKRAAGPVARTAQESIGRFQGASVSTIGPRASVKGAFVTQRARKRTGLRGDFGAMQMRILIASLFEHEHEIEREVEKLLDHLTRENGF